MYVLGIESSCDETGMAIFDTNQGLLAHTLHSQIDIHARFGGVVPELASRNHVESLIPVLEETLLKAGLTKQNIDAIAYTAGPGLVGALLTGACFAKSLAFSLNKPALAVHHLEAHVLAAFLDAPHLTFPFLSLLVSGGHTQLFEARKLGEYHLLGETLDDAVGEAFDKTAKLMGIPYPGGPALAKLADNYNKTSPFPPFPRPMIDRPGFDFSFSGLKTHALLTWLRSEQNEEAKSAIAHAFQEAVVDTLTLKCKRALLETHHRTLVVAGGVGANQCLRTTLKDMTKTLGVDAVFPSQAFCTDNGAMIAYAGAQYLAQGKQDGDWQIQVKARWPLQT